MIVAPSAGLPRNRISNSRSASSYASEFVNLHSPFEISSGWDSSNQRHQRGCSQTIEGYRSLISRTNHLPPGMNKRISMSSVREFENKLANDTVYRVAWLREFLELSAEEIEAIHHVSHRLTIQLQDLVDRMYDLFTEQDATLRHFARPQAGYDGPIPVRLEEITPDHPIMKQRKAATLRFLVGLVSRPFNASAIHHLDWIGKLHNSQAGPRDFKLPAVQFEAGMGFVSTALTPAVAALNLPRNQESLVHSGLQKICWILNDVLLNRLADPPVADSDQADHRRNSFISSE